MTRIAQRGTSIIALLFSSIALVLADDEENCGLWLGPSHVKETAEHGFGLGLYTGRRIAQGEVMAAELFLPIYDLAVVDHPPLREYLWEANAHKNLVLEVYGNLLFFSPGLGAIAPCTDTNFNLERLDNVTFDNAGVHRSKDATAGAFTYYTQSMFRAVRTIEKGEELTVECEDDDFDADDLGSSRFSPRDDNFVCLDDKLEERSRSNIPGIGRGVFAKKDLTKDTVILSSPAVPIDRKLLEISSLDPVGTQLLLNYCYGHPGSDLLWFPYGPLINSINHYGDAPNIPNVRVQWHSDQIRPKEELSRRKQYHHPELLDYTAERVSLTHGKGLLMDLVATRRIEQGEEIYLDYGASWAAEWKLHEQNWKSFGLRLKDAESYFPAAEYNRLHGKEPIRTITEQHRTPYPHNILTACHFQKDWIEDENSEDYDMIQYQSWNTQEEHYNCLLPCVILERVNDEDGSGEVTYTAKLIDHHHDNESIEYECHIFRRFEYIYTDIPRHGIEFIEAPYSSDGFLTPAFRQPIELPPEMVSDAWMRQKVRRRTTSHLATPEQKEEEDQFKRKNIEPKYDKEDIQRKKMASPRTDL